MKIAIVGCGYVADLYLQTLALHRELELIAVYDRDVERQRRFMAYYKVRGCNSLEAILTSDAELVLNLTNPHSHYEVSKACLEAGKHVYSEKPLAMNLADATQIVELASAKDLLIVSAPCSVLGESAQTMCKAVRDKLIGEVYAVYAEMDDGLVHRMPYRSWFSKSGTPWPSKDEFEVGCTLEHAGYVLTWLCAMFGPATNLTAFGSTTIHDKKTDQPLNFSSPDLTVACLRFASGIVARLTCSIVAKHDHHLRIFGESGILSTQDSWNYRSPICLQRYMTIRRRMILNPWKKKLPLAGRSNPLVNYGGSSYMDFCRGAAELANSLSEKRPCRMSPRFTLHVNELVLAISAAREGGICQKITSTFDPIEPMPWAI